MRASDDKAFDILDGVAWLTDLQAVRDDRVEIDENVMPEQIVEFSLAPCYRRAQTAFRCPLAPAARSPGR